MGGDGEVPLCDACWLAAAGVGGSMVLTSSVKYKARHEVKLGSRGVRKRGKKEVLLVHHSRDGLKGAKCLHGNSSNYGPSRRQRKESDEE